MISVALMSETDRRVLLPEVLEEALKIARFFFFFYKTAACRKRQCLKNCFLKKGGDQFKDCVTHPLSFRFREALPLSPLSDLAP